MYSDKIRVLFVCLGNICRSPLAEACFIHLVQEKNLENHFVIDSAGTGSWHVGEAADERMISTAQKRGIQVNSKARQFIHEDFKHFDYIIAMDRQNKKTILSKCVQPTTAQIFLLRDFESDDPYQAVAQDVPDPWYDDMDAFEKVFNIVHVATDNLLETILKEKLPSLCH